MVILVVSITVRAGKEAEVAEHLRVLEIESRKEPGCIFYAAQQHRDEPRKFLVYEQYRDEAALEAHRNSAHFKRHAAEGLYPHVAERTADFYRPVPGADLR